MADVFISYASQDREAARTLGERLVEHGHSVWWDRTIPPGRAFDEVIQEALSAARCVVVLWSAQSVQSNWVKVEGEDAMARNRLVPVLIEAVAPPIQFRRIQAANLVGWDGDADHAEFQNLLAAIERLLAQTSDTADSRRPVLREQALTARRTGQRRQALVLAIAGTALAAASLYVVFSLKDGRTNGSAPQSLTNPGTPTSASERRADRINLVAPENGGELLAAPDATWAAAVDGNEATSLTVYLDGGRRNEAVFGFKDGRAATFDTVEVLIPDSRDSNVAEFELLTGNDQIDGRFESVDVFRTRNILLVKEPYQRFTFQARTSRYVKFRVLKAHGASAPPWLYEWRLLGMLK
jgi:hypothetical protein